MKMSMKIFTLLLVTFLIFLFQKMECYEVMPNCENIDYNSNCVYMNPKESVFEKKRFLKGGFNPKPKQAKNVNKSEYPWYHYKKYFPY
ncbi:hypothetical protein FF38_05470 [Lucilia cuprina]|uniref:Uncharacterized protein n=1 Tax=Lucilia cuprina TaxID=7375 RepID=A0A0L0C0F1_LUCCU|nr:hypothetical protein CVS40_3250 [Lucilia cuprina]KNC25787.1 hypothetical protein FF38_05470 [Lucilia cuprina]